VEVRKWRTIRVEAGERLRSYRESKRTGGGNDDGKRIRGKSDLCGSIYAVTGELGRNGTIQLP
jgi:hypothetical protein